MMNLFHTQMIAGAHTEIYQKNQIFAQRQFIVTLTIDFFKQKDGNAEYIYLYLKNP
jgi:hypothetical protein